MPLLGAEIDQWPAQLITSDAALEHPWWVMYTLARQEKKLMRILVEEQIRFYSPVITRRYRSPNGRLRVSYEPLFANYVFVQGEETERYRTICTGCISRCLEVIEREAFVEDLRQVYELIATGCAVSPESRIEAGQKVRVKNGVFKGFEGSVLRRENEVRLLVTVRYMGQGASVALDDCQLEVIGE